MMGNLHFSDRCRQSSYFGGGWWRSFRPACALKNGCKPRPSLFGIETTLTFCFSRRYLDGGFRYN